MIKSRTASFDHWPLVVLVAIFCVLAVSFSLLFPLNEAPDEESHFDLIRFIAEQRRIPLTGQERASLGDKGDASPFYHVAVALLSQHVDLSPLPTRHVVSAAKQAIAYDRTLTTQDLHTEDELLPFRGMVLAWHLARLVSIPLSALTIVAAYVTALAIYPEKRYFALAVAGFVAFVPRFVINSAVVSDDNLVIPLVAFAIYVLVRVIQGDERPRTFIILGMLSGLATITKYHSVILLPEVTLVFMVLAWRNQAEWKQWVKRWAWVMFSFILTTGWWFFFLFSRFNRVAELGLMGGLLAPLGDPTTTEVAGFQLTPRSFSWAWIAPVFRTFWVFARATHVYAPDFLFPILVLLAFAAGLGLVRLIYIRLSPPGPRKWRLDIALLAVHFLIYLGIVFGRYQVFLARGTTPPPHSTQGRHLYPALVSIAFFLVLGWESVLAVRARKPEEDRVAGSNDRFLAGAVTIGMLALTIVTFFSFLRPSYLPPLPIITRRPDEVAISQRMQVSFAEGLNFIGYNLGKLNPSENSVPIDLYWLAEAEQDRTYIAQVCLRDDEGNTVSCHWGHPADGLYPTRAWDVGYLIRDERLLPAPYCLGATEYELTLSVWPLSDDSASTTIDQAGPAQEPLSLGLVTLTPGSQGSKSSLYVCLADTCYTRGQITLSQIRQTLTAISYTRDPEDKVDGESIRLILKDAASQSQAEWLPFQATAYQCPNGQWVQTHTFIVDASVAPGSYRLEANDRPKSEIYVNVKTRPRNFDSPPDPEKELGISFAQQVDLLGYDVDLSPRWPTDSIEVTTYWKTQQKMPTNYNVAVHLVDNAQTTQGLVDHFLGGLYPNVLWEPGEFTQDTHVLQNRGQTPLPGLYTLELRVYDYSQGRFQPLAMKDLETNQPVDINPTLGQVRIIDPAQKNPPEHSKMVVLGQEIQLVGYDLPNTQASPGQPLSVALRWKAIAQPTTNYTVFTQLVGPDGLVWGQQDNQPQQGRYPTAAWSVGDKVVDRFDILVREDAPAGTYRLLAGMYDLATGERQPAYDENGQRLADDAIVLSNIDMMIRP